MPVHSNTAGVSMLETVTGPTPIPPRDGVPDLDDVRLAAWRNVRTAGDSVVGVVSDELEASTGLPLDWYEVLLHIYEDGEGSLPQHELDRRCALSQSGISRMVSKMEKEGLIRREQAPHDRRNVLVILTPAGRDVFVRATPIHHLAVQRHFGVKLTDEQARQINSGLARVVESVEGPTQVETNDRLDQVITFGQSVLSLTSESVAVSDAVQIRDAIEPLLLLDASRHVTEETVNAMQAIVMRMSTLIDEPEAFFRADWDLHRQIAGVASNQLVKSVYLQLLDVISSHMDSVVPTTNLKSYLYERLAVHARLVDAVASGDPDKVTAAAHAHHFTDVRSRLVDGITDDVTEISSTDRAARRKPRTQVQ